MPESLGRTLKKVRESKHLSIEEVSERTRIPKNIVSAIEEDKLNEIKSPFYAKSFVKTYSSFLGALAEPVIKGYLGSCHIQRKPEPVSSKPVINQNPQIDFSIIIKHRKPIVATVTIVFVFWVFLTAVIHLSKSIKNISKKEHKTIIVKKEMPKKIENEKDVKKGAPSEKPDIVELEISALDNTWIQVVGDGELLFTGLFKKGNKDVWKAKKEIKFEVGSAGTIKINVNRKSIGPPGKKGEKKEFIITKDGIKLLNHEKDF